MLRVKQYYEFDSLASIYLEDSYVLEIVTTESQLTFRLDAVLTESHSAYRPPRPGEQYCYQYGDLIFSNVSRVEWLKRTQAAIHNLDGTIDYGNIDSMSWTGEEYYIEGEWGQVCVVSDPPIFKLDKSRNRPPQM